jgi:hypothetical protein
MTTIVTGFFAYPSHPVSIPELTGAAIEGINRSGAAKIMGWEECRTGGKIIIQTICQAIDQSDMFLVLLR